MLKIFVQLFSAFARKIKVNPEKMSVVSLQSSLATVVQTGVSGNYRTRTLRQNEKKT